MLHIIKRITSPLLVVGTGEIIKYCKLSFIIGSHAAFFSATQLYTPLVGRFGGAQASILYFILRTLYKACIEGAFSSFIIPLFFKLSVYHTPALLGSLYGAWLAPVGTQDCDNLLTLKKLTLSLLCLSCILLFACHEVGGRALPYACLWVIPVVVPFWPTRSLFVHALASTLASHGLGSVLWLYTHQTAPEFWLGLIPLACTERLLFALGITFLSRLIEALANLSLTYTTVSTLFSRLPVVRNALISSNRFEV